MLTLTSSPKSTIRGSRSISSTSASLIAWMNRRLCHHAFSLRRHSGADLGNERPQEIGLRHVAGSRRRGPHVDALCHLGVDRRKSRRVGDAVALQLLGEARQRILLAPGRDLFLGAVGFTQPEDLGLGMAAQAIGASPR